MRRIQDGLLYSNLLLKMYLMSLKHNGVLMLNDRLPHTPQTIATFTRHQIGTVERAIKVFLRDEELTELQTELPTLWQNYIDRLSEYMASTGKQYRFKGFWYSFFVDFL